MRPCAYGGNLSAQLVCEKVFYVDAYYVDACYVDAYYVDA